MIDLDFISIFKLISNSIDELPIRKITPETDVLKRNIKKIVALEGLSGMFNEENVLKV
ncbi:MAG: hypothetical protein ACOC3T_02805 [Bacteroidota bacterium]